MTICPFEPTTDAKVIPSYRQYNGVAWEDAGRGPANSRLMSRPTPPSPPLWQVLLLTGLAGGLGWGIRGQYGHQTGAMMAGLLVALTLTLLFRRGLGSRYAAQAVALGAIGMAFGGSMTYAQTVGLTHDPDLRGNWPALLWGMTGLFVKGGLWVGLAGAFLGMGLSTRRYRALEVCLLFVVLIALTCLGMYVLGEPFDPAHHRLPAVYFSATWNWFPLKADPKPRYENWGGLLFALAGLIGYLQLARKDMLARNLALWGVLCGGLGWVAAQSIQTYHAWNVEQFRQGWFSPIEPVMNWWNTMETAFGMCIGAGLGLGVWLNRRRVGPKDGEDAPELTPGMEALGIGIHAAALIAWEFLEYKPVDDLGELTFALWLLPAVAVVGGRLFPYALTLPLIALPIAGKTLREMCYKTHQVPVPLGWVLFVALPLTALSWAAWQSFRRSEQQSAGEFSGRALLWTVWTYWALNFAFFQFPWPWQAPTFRTPNTLAFTLCAGVLTYAVFKMGQPSTTAEPLTTALPETS